MIHDVRAVCSCTGIWVISPGGEKVASGKALTKGKRVWVPAETVLHFKLEIDVLLEPCRW